MAVAAALLMLAAAQAAPTEQSPPAIPGITRTDLQRHDLSIAGRETIQTRVDFAPGAAAPKHKHPGEEIVYVLAGTLEYRLEGQPVQVVRAGEVLFIPNGTVHSATNVGLETASELATYIVEKGKPLADAASQTIRANLVADDRGQ